MDTSFCVETLEDALMRHGKPDIFNTDQGSQFTGAAFTSALAENAPHGIFGKDRPSHRTKSTSNNSKARARPIKTKPTPIVWIGDR
jgi:transposase InsO family protein